MYPSVIGWLPDEEVARAVQAEWRDFLRVALNNFWTEAEIVKEHAEDSTDESEISNPLERMFPELDGERNAGIFRQAAVGFGI